MSKFSIFVSHVKSAIRTPRAYFTTFRFRKPLTDLERWSVSANLDPDWDERTLLITHLIPPGSSVIEFGAARLVLQKNLHPTCYYQPVDVVKRSDDTIVLDLNEALPEFPRRYDIAVFSGVLEYVHDLERLFNWLPSICGSVIFSYAVTDSLSDPVTRRKHGWVNGLSQKEILNLAEEAGLQVIEKQNWRRQIIFSCRFDARAQIAENR